MLLPSLHNHRVVHRLLLKFWVEVMMFPIPILPTLCSKTWLMQTMFRLRTVNWLVPFPRALRPTFPMLTMWVEALERWEWKRIATRTWYLCFCGLSDWNILIQIFWYRSMILVTSMPHQKRPCSHQTFASSNPLLKHSRLRIGTCLHNSKLNKQNFI